MKTEQRRQPQILKKRTVKIGHLGLFAGVSAGNALDNAVDTILRQAGRFPVAHATFEGADTTARERALKALKIKAEEMETESDSANRLDIACDKLVAQMILKRRPL